MRILCGDSINLSHFGTIAWRTSEQMKHPWNAACFYDQELADLYDQLTCMKSLAPVGNQNIGIVGPGGRATRGCFEKSDTRQHPDRCALWDNKSERQICMSTNPDIYLVAKAGVKHKTVNNLWDKRSRLLLPERLRLNLACTSAVYSDKPILGSAFTPVRVILKNK